ncbi:unnamed protein product [Lepeophtheirus salmonis]|uniref:(salmon louse) hypothetical protein n=1 Tax=Lepeophtheirus salmonis TaxID=72036 RepID=A0A0K2T7F4_LEPSM|nr:uncharacterized protein LOC121117829 isoform X1 [Lepeophtheirus salmonis]CAB4063977.1 unnamed protein product [Lepeophtheirus salmonis]CAF2934173.1 unnamed protein product [Lepeophtheirus salmonis]
MGLAHDILPDTNVDREWTKSGKWAMLVLTTASTFITIAFTTPYWLESDPRFYQSKVAHVGLWVHCFRSLPDFYDLKNERYFAGCRWLYNPFTEGYSNIRNILAPPFFVATQFFFTICFTTMLLSIVLVLIYLLCIDEYYRVRMLRWTGFDLILSGGFGAVALIVFGIYGDGRDYMPDWENNYISWSFGLGFVGVVMEFVSGVLFIVESRIMLRKEIAREKQYPMEKRV